MSQPQPLILAIIPNDALSLQVQAELQRASYKTTVVQTSRQAWQQLEASPPALILIDMAHLAKSGVQLCQTIRTQGDRTPILLLMESETLSDRIICLEAGADDYILLPYCSERLIEQVSFYLKMPEPANSQLQFSDLSLELNSRRAIRSGRAFDLTMKEFELLRYLMQHPHQVVTREQILQNVWGYDSGGESNVIEVYIRYLRLKIEENGGKRLIQTVRGVGYVLREA